MTSNRRAWEVLYAHGLLLSLAVHCCNRTHSALLAIKQTPELYFPGPSAGREDEFAESAALCLLFARLLVDLLFARMCTLIPDLRCVCMAGMMGLYGVFRVGM